MQNRPPYSLLRQNYPDSASVPSAELWQWIGHPKNDDDPKWHNTCAIRVSLALLGAGLQLPHGFLTVQAGKYKGRKIEIKQEALADYLATVWGPPERFATALLEERVRHQRGIIRFVNLWGPFDPQGHIDLIDGVRWSRVGCEGRCYTQAVESWFWPCP